MAIDLESARERMVLEQLERRGIKDPRVLAAMRTVPRHRFLPAELHDHAYDDGPLPIGDSQTISQPYMVALMSEVAELTGTEKVLEVGTGSGYQTAVLAQLARTVYSVELNLHLHDRARVILNSLGVSNVYLRCGDGSDGWPEEAPFDVVMVTAAMPGIALPLLNQLTPAGPADCADWRRRTPDPGAHQSQDRALERGVFRRVPIREDDRQTRLPGLTY